MQQNNVLKICNTPVALLNKQTLMLLHYLNLPELSNMHGVVIVKLFFYVMRLLVMFENVELNKAYAMTTFV